MNTVRFLRRPAHPIEAQVVAGLSFAAVLSAGVAMHRAIAGVVVIAACVWLGVRLAGRRLAAEALIMDEIEAERRAA